MNRLLVLCALLAACSHPAAPPSQPAPPRGAPEPPPVSSLLTDANQAYEQHRFHACGELFADAASRAGEAKAGEYAYDAACCYSLDGDTDASFRLLSRALDAGYDDLGLLDRDPDLATARADARWAAVRARAQAKLDAYLATVNRELAELYQADQADRQGTIDWTKVHERDLARQRRVVELVAGGAATVADDFYHAAMVLQHGDRPEDYLQAHEWALRAVALDPNDGAARWLAAASEDRHLMSLGKPQRYGTQYKKVDGTFVLHTVDPTVTDEERAKWNVPPLAEAIERLDTLNAKGAP